MMAPFTLKVWIGLGNDQPLTDPAMLSWLGRPYDKRNGDPNFGRERRSELLAVFGGWDQFRRTAEVSEAACRKHLAEVTDLDRKCAHARRAALRRIAVHQGSGAGTPRSPPPCRRRRRLPAGSSRDGCAC